MDWLGTITGPLAEAALIRLLAHPAPGVVKRAAERLGRVGSPGVEDALVELVRQKTHRAAARQALALLRQRYPQSLGGEPVKSRRR
jgi:HEAT repeat protein